ncbi:MAG: hypothetical protein WBG38_03360 [Nodosilinea sp.]
MGTGFLIHVAAFPGWLAGVTYHKGLGYCCWVINPELAVLNDGEVYASSAEAIAAGRLFIHHSMGLEPDLGSRG